MGDRVRCILLVSGKRKSGKDYISEKLKGSLTVEKSCIVRISEPIKSYYAEKNNLDLSELLSDGPYKELHRLDMIKWSEGVRAQTPGVFCEAACKNAPSKQVWIVSDVRRKTDIVWFKKTYGALIRTVRINASEGVRKSRGWIFTEGVDDVTSECDLDDYTPWDLEISNDSESSLRSGFEKLLQLVNS